MSGPFVPAAFENPVIAPQATTLTRRVPYVSVSEFMAAPTGISMTSLVTGGTPAQQTAEAYAILLRASDAIDIVCFHGPDGTLAASPTIDSGWIRPKPNGDLWLQCNMKPILEVNGMAMGSSPQMLQDIDSSSAESISIDGTIIRAAAPVGTYTPFSPTSLSAPPTRRGQSYVAWTYISGFPHMTLAADAAQGATSITVQPAVPGGSAPYGVYPGTQLTVRDAEGGVEVVMVSSVQGNVLSLTEPLAYAHTVPADPDAVMVSAIPDSVEQACISMATYLVKLRGSRAAVMQTIASGAVKGPKVSTEAGGGNDYDTAVSLLQPFTTVSRRNSAA